MKMIDLEKFSTPKEAIVPVINKRSIFNGRHFQLDERDGWYKVELGDNVLCKRPATDVEVEQVLASLPEVRGYTIEDSLIPLNFDSVKYKYGYSETVPVMFIASELWDVIRASQYEDCRLYYHDIDTSFNRAVLNEVKKRFEEEKPIGEVKGITPELRYLYLLLALQRDNYREIEKLKSLKLSQTEKEKRLKEFQETFAGRLLKVVESAGGKLIRFHKQGRERIVVIWKVGGQVINSLVKLDFRVVEAGFCLSGEDKLHSLSSLIPLAQTYQEESPLYITRE